MTCARRQAGAQRPAPASPSPSAGSPSRPEPRSGRARARFFRLLPALALLFGALWLSAPAPAAAAVLVSNIGQTQASGAGGFIPDRNGAAAQGFRTGSHTAGYTLTSIELQVRDAITTPANYRVELWSATTGGAPNAKIASLTVPSTLSGTGAKTFNAPSGTTLNASTTYFVVFYRTSASSSAKISQTSATDEDSGAATGWSIHDSRHYAVGATNWLTGGNPFRIRVNGAAKTTTPTTTLPGQVWSATLTTAELSGAFGCNNAATGAATCTTALSGGNTFTVGGTSYSIERLIDDPPPISHLAITFNAVPNSALRALKFCVGTTGYDISEVGSTSLGHDYTGSLGWSAGETVDLAIASSCQQTATQSSDATLSGLTASTSTSSTGTFTSLTLTPSTFAPATTAYTATVANARRHLKLTATVNESNAAVKYRKGTTGSFTDLTSGTASAAIGLDEGSNAFTVRVTAQDSTTKDYTVTITRETVGLVPTGVTATPGDGKLTVTWTNDAGITSHDEIDVRWREQGTSSWSSEEELSSTTTSYEISGLTNGRTYDVGVRIYDASGPAGSRYGSWVSTTGTPTAAGTVTASLSASPNPVVEGSTTELTVTLSGTLSSNVRIPVTFTNDSAETEDYPASGQTAYLGVGAGATFGRFDVETNHDTDEDDETFTVSLGTLPAGVTAGSPSSVRITIRDDEGIPEISLLPSSGALSVEEGKWVGIEVSLPRTGPTVRVPLVVRHGTSEEGDWGDRTHRRRDGSWRFHANAHPDPDSYYSRGWFSIPTNRDSDHDDETFTIELDTAKLPAGYAAGTPSKVTVTIRDPDKPHVPSVILRATPNPVAEGEPVAVTAILTTVSDREVTVPLMAVRGTSEEDDHAMRASIVIPAGRCCRWVHVATHRDADGDDETFTVTMDPDNVPAGYRREARSSAEVYIADDGAARAPGTVPAVSLSASPNPVPEGGEVRVTATLSAALSRDVTVPLTVSRVSSERHDHGTLAGLFIAAGSLSATGAIGTREDPDTDDERFTVSLGTLPADLRAGRPSSVGVRIADSGNNRLGRLEMQAGN